MLSSNLETVATTLQYAKCPEDVFGPLAGAIDLLAAYRRLVKIAHPDTYRAADAIKLATEAFRQLNDWRDLAEAKLALGTYGDGKPLVAPSPPPAPAAPVTVTVGKVTYTTGPVAFEGDIATLYAVNAVGHRTPFTDTALFKVVRSAGDNDLMEAEAKALRILIPKPGPVVAEDRLLPQLLDTFLLKGKGPARRVNVLTHHGDHHSLSEVKRAYPDGIDFRDWAWMFKRALQALGFAHRKGLVHGAVLPPHILIHPVHHGIKLVDWGYSSAIGGRVHAVVLAYREFYPPEIFIRRLPKSLTASPGTDIYMLARCGFWMLGGDLVTGAMPGPAPRAIQAFLNGCLLASPARRPQDAWGLHAEFDELLERLVGPKKYRPFAMPART